MTLLLGALVTATWAQNRPLSRTRDRKSEKRDRINAMLRQEEEGELIYNKQSIFGIRLSTDGYGISYEFGRFKTPRLSLLYQFELNEKKHPKEKKVAIADNSYQLNNIIYGKENNFYQFKFGLAQQYLVGGKGNKNGVAVTAVYGGGASLGLLKPYMVDIQDPSGQKRRSTYPTIIDSGYREQGAAGLTVGWDKMKLSPGLYAKTAMRFDYGRFNETVTAIEVGLNVEYYFIKIPQMSYNPEKNFFFNAYVSLLLGHRK